MYQMGERERERAPVGVGCGHPKEDKVGIGNITRKKNTCGSLRLRLSLPSFVITRHSYFITITPPVVFYLLSPAVESILGATQNVYW